MAKPKLVRRVHVVYEVSHRRGCRLLHLNWSSFTYRPKSKPDEGALTVRLRDLAGTRVRYGYRRLTVLLKREGWQVGKKRVYRIYKQEGLEMRTKWRKKLAGDATGTICQFGNFRPTLPIECMADKLVDRKRFPVLAVVDNFDCSNPMLFADQSIRAEKATATLEHAVNQTGNLPQTSTVD